MSEPAEDLLPADPVDRFRRADASLSWGELAEGTEKAGHRYRQQLFGQHPSQVVLLGDQHPVQELPAQSADDLSLIAFALAACRGGWPEP